MMWIPDLFNVKIEEDVGNVEGDEVLELVADLDTFGTEINE